MKHNKHQSYPGHNSAPKQGTTRRKVLAWAGGIAAAAGLAGFGVNKYNQAENKRNAEVDAQLGEKIGPAMRALSQKVVDTKNKTKGGFALQEYFDKDGGTVKLWGYEEVPIGGGKDKISLSVVMGVDSEGKPNPNDPRSFRLGRETEGLDVDHRLKADLAAPGVEVFDHGKDDGWFAGYSSALKSDPTAVYRSSDDRTSWAGNPNPDPFKVADRAIETATTQLNQILNIPR